MDTNCTSCNTYILSRTNRQPSFWPRFRAQHSLFPNCRKSSSMNRQECIRRNCSKCCGSIKFQITKFKSKGNSNAEIPIPGPDSFNGLELENCFLEFL